MKNELVSSFIFSHLLHSCAIKDFQLSSMLPILIILMTKNVFFYAALHDNCRMVTLTIILKSPFCDIVTVKASKRINSDIRSNPKLQLKKEWLEYIFSVFNIALCKEIYLNGYWKLLRLLKLPSQYFQIIIISVKQSPFLFFLNLLSSCRNT